MKKSIARVAAGVALATATAFALMSQAAANEPPVTSPCPCITEYGAAGVVVRARILDKVRVNVVEASVETRGHKESSLADINIPIPPNDVGLRGSITGQMAPASATAGGGESHARAEVANLNVVLQGPVNLGLSAFLLRSTAHARCAFPESSTSGDSQILGLSTIVNGLRGEVSVTGEPNQTIYLAGGARLIVNEQRPEPFSGVGWTRPRITVNALHLIVPNIADIAISSAHAAVTCFCRPTT